VSGLVIRGMKGLGDNIFQRPFVRAAAASQPVFIETPWPQIYADLFNVFPVHCPTSLRTQAKNVEAWGGEWHRPPSGAAEITVRYAPSDLRRRSITETIERLIGPSEERIHFDLPADLPAPPSMPPYAVVRPVTVRREWLNEARNPYPEHVAQAAALLRARGLKVILVADIDGQAEKLVGDLPPHDGAFLAGELGVSQLLALVRGAAAVAGGVGWIVPAAIAAQTPAFVIQGGQLAHNAPHVITDLRMNLTRVGWARTDRPCACEDMTHNCRKRISNLPAQFETWAERAGL